MIVTIWCIIQKEEIWKTSTILAIRLHGKQTSIWEVIKNRSYRNRVEIKSIKLDKPQSVTGYHVNNAESQYIIPEIVMSSLSVWREDHFKVKLITHLHGEFCYE
jgi:hypothetical protein